MGSNCTRLHDRSVIGMMKESKSMLILTEESQVRVKFGQEISSFEQDIYRLPVGYLNGVTGMKFRRKQWPTCNQSQKNIWNHPRGE